MFTQKKDGGFGNPMHRPFFILFQQRPLMFIKVS